MNPSPTAVVAHAASGICGKLANSLRALSMDAVQLANSGHPGAPMGMAEMAVALWHGHLRHNPANPHWADRDRFVLSNGHASMLLYALLHLSGYALPLGELKRFRQLGSKTPGHPEHGLTPGVETTTGPHCSEPGRRGAGPGRRRALPPPRKHLSKPVRYDLISFDLDGTLVDTASEIAEAANRALEEHGLARRPLTEITDLIGAGTRQLMLTLLARALFEQPALSQSMQPEVVLAGMDHHYAKTAGSTAAPYAGCRDALAQLKTQGVRLACVTNKELRHALRVFQAARLDDYFDLIVGGDSLPEKKPHRSVLRHVASSLKVHTDRCAHVGDSAIDVEAARNAGVAAWAVPYGYNAGVPIAEARPERIFQSLTQVAEHVLAHRVRASA